MIYIDNAATRLGNYGLFNINSPYATDNKVKFEHARDSIAKVLNIRPEYIYFTSGGCEANSWALQRCKVKNIITTRIEHHSILKCCEYLEKHGCQVFYLDTTEEGYVDLLELDKLLASLSIEPTLVSIMAVNNEIGAVQPLTEIRKVIDFYNKKRKETSESMKEPFDCPIYFHSDCVQAIGSVDIDLSVLDMFSASGHKFGAPYGVGFLYSKIPLDPLIFGGSQEKGLRGGTSNYDSVIRMADALEKKTKYLSDKLHINTLIKYLRHSLKEFDCIINTPEESTSPILSVSFKDINAEGLMIYLEEHRIYVSAGSACSTDHKEISHVLQTLNLPEEYINGTIRFSLSEYNSESEIDHVIALIKEYVRS